MLKAFVDNGSLRLFPSKSAAARDDLFPMTDSQWSERDERSRSGGTAMAAVSECGQRVSFN
jgi:hypothetical protein